MQAKLERRYSNGIYLLNSFTWSKGINNASANLETNGGDSAVVNIANPASDRGLSSYDQTLNNTLTVIADLPFGKDRMFGQSARVAAGSAWGMAAFCNQLLQQRATDQPDVRPPNAQYAVSSTSAAYSVRPNLVGTASAVYAPRGNWVKTKSALSGTLNASQVTVPTPSQYFGTAGRNILRGPAFGQLDLAAHKSISLWSEWSKLEFRIEAFNVLNSTNFNSPIVLSLMERVSVLTRRRTPILPARCSSRCVSTTKTVQTGYFAIPFGFGNVAK